MPTQFNHVTFPSTKGHAHSSASTELVSVFLGSVNRRVVEKSQAEMNRSGTLVVVVFLSSLLGKMLFISSDMV